MAWSQAEARRLLGLAQADVRARWRRYEQLAHPDAVLSDQQPSLAARPPVQTNAAPPPASDQSAPAAQADEQATGSPAGEA